MSRYRCLYDNQGKLAEFSGDDLIWARKGAFDDMPAQGPQIMRDINPYRNMINGKIITSRTEHRELLKRHNCVEIGNDTAFLKPQPKPKSDKRKRVLASQMADLSDRQIKGLIKQEIKARRH